MKLSLGFVSVSVSVAVSCCALSHTAAAASVPFEEQILVPDITSAQVTLSPRGVRVAAVIPKGSRQALLLDGVEGPRFDEIMSPGGLFEFTGMGGQALPVRFDRPNTTGHLVMGLGAGSGGGTGGGVYRPGSGIINPRVLREVKPQYTADAMRAKVQGTVLLECVILPDGSVGRVDVVRSLDSTFGLDQEAVKAARQWRFQPGTRFGEPVAVLVTIELTFTLR